MITPTLALPHQGGWNNRKIQSLPLPLREGIEGRGRTIIGGNLLETQRLEPKRFAVNARALMNLFSLGKLKVPPIACRYPLEKAAEAIEAAACVKIAGRVVIDIAGGR